jgi:hypothetical protein
MSHSRTGTVDRRAFLKDAALAAATATGLSGGLGALSGLWAQPRDGGTVTRSIIRPGETRPFNMICLGDSVMWGQGLNDSSKFTTKVKTWLESRLPGRTVNNFVYARSGATIGPDADVPNESAVQPWMNNRALGEVPCSWPWVQQQVTIARDDLASQNIPGDSVDLVLLDGGINDVNVKTLLNATNDEALIRNKSRNLCGIGMTHLLPRVRNSFPKAKILVTGYFPIVSEESDLIAVGLLLGVFFGPVALVTLPIRSALAKLSTAFYQASNQDFGAAVAEFNRSSGRHPMYGTSPAAFAQIPWRAANCYAGSDCYLWFLGLPHDEVWSSRQWACRTAGAEHAVDPFCQDAKMGHPNRAGAAAYASACTAQLGQYLPEWQGAKLMSACVEMDPMPAAGTATTLTVHATERGGPALAGTVRVGTVTFPTDTAVPLSLCTRRTMTVAGAATGDGREREREPQTVTRTVCTPMIVSVPGYVDVVISNYLSATPVP